MRINFNSPPVDFKMSDRSGELIYTEKNRYISVFVEMSAVPQYDILVWLNLLKEGKWSNGESVSKDDFEKIKSAFYQWADKNNIKCQW